MWTCTDHRLYNACFLLWVSHLNSVDVTHCSVLLLWFQFLFQFLLDLFEFYFAHIIHWMFAIQKSDHSPVTEPVVKSCQASFCQVLVHADYSQDLPLILDFCDCQIVRSLMCAGTLEQVFSVLLLVISTLLHSKVNKRQESWICNRMILCQRPLPVCCHYTNQYK